MVYASCDLPHGGTPASSIADSESEQSYNVDSPNEMVVDTDDYVGVANAPEKDSVAIINPDGLEQGDSDAQLQDLPLANDCTLPVDRSHDLVYIMKLIYDIQMRL